MQESKITYKSGDMVVYTNGTRQEVGTIKRFRDNGDAFVWYHTGDTASCTPLDLLRKFYLHDLDNMSNKYAYEVLKERSDKIKKGEIYE